MKIKAPQGVLALAASLLAFSGPAAAVFEDFTIQEGSVPGALDNEIEADKLNGGYTEVLTINPDFSFDTVAFGTIGQIFANEGTPPGIPSQLGCLSTDCYELYFTFSASGTFLGGIFTATVGTFELFIDPNQDTTFAFAPGPGAGALPVVIGGDGEDFQIASASNPVSLIGVVGDPGAFDFVWNDFTLTDNAVGPDGSDYFTSPDPFHMRVVVDGDFDEFPTLPGDITLRGDVSAVFEVPEPATLALFGLGLAGLGLRARRRKS